MDISAEHFVNRELSWLQFNRRVLEEAQLDRTPLLERAKFLSIVSSNLDEFFMVRVAGLHNPHEEMEEDPAGLSREEQLHAVRLEAAQLISDQYSCCMDAVMPALAEHGIRILRPDDWGNDDYESLRHLYHDHIEATLTPLAVDVGRPFPLIANGTVYIALQLQNADATDEIVNALVSVPKSTRMLQLVSAKYHFALIEDVVEVFAGSLFPGYTLKASCQIRVTRDGSLDIDEDAANDLLSEIEQELHHRVQGSPVRLEINESAPADLQEWLVDRLHIEEHDIFRIGGFSDLSFMMGFYGKLAPDFPQLCDQPHKPAALQLDWSDPYARIREQELLLYHPYHSFQPVIDLVASAATDDKVLAIKMTLYRVSGNSPIIKHLIDAVHAGKQVTVLVELKARFDEQANIRWARRLEEAGAHVIYGLVGLKVHTKLLLLIRQDEDGIRRYCHIGTGNYNDKTAHLYTDYSYCTSDEAVGRDVAALFNVLTGFAQPPQWERLAVSPLTLRSSFYKWIDREIKHAEQGRPAAIKAKFNSLVDEGICRALYRASQAGVQITLVIRGICILRPGVPGISEHIEVRSVVGRFLEHSRWFWFHNNGEPTTVIGSADWMTRNLDRRIESMVRITDARLQQQLLELFEMFIRDNTHSRLMLPDGSYRLIEPAAGEADYDAQAAMIDLAHEQQQIKELEQQTTPDGVFRPQRRQGSG